MRQLNLPDSVLFTFTDAAPPPAAWTYSFPDADPAEHPDVARAWLPDGQFHTRFAVFALERNGEVVLFDTGLGPTPNPYFNGLAGHLDDELRHAGISLSSIAHVVFTHFHLDHVGWAGRADGTPMFPNAVYHAPRAELAHWRRYGREAALPHHVEAFERSLQPLIAAGRVVPQDASQPFIDLNGITIAYRAAAGHTRGHHAVEIIGREKVLIGGDAWHSPAQISAPDWGHRADRDPVQARVSRLALAEWAYRENAIVAAGHFREDISFGRIRAGNKGIMEFRPIDTPAT
jgi:glyoxylase-like metal-dependent hydrolase (beta-lactamase superfamily II)